MRKTFSYFSNRHVRFLKLGFFSIEVTPVGFYPFGSLSVHILGKRVLFWTWRYSLRRRIELWLGL